MSILKELSTQSIERKISFFLETFEPGPSTRILEIGTESNFDGKRLLQFLDVYEYKHNVTVVNRSRDQILRIRERYPDVTAIVADACELPFGDKSFDIVYSNTAIEHVGDLQLQEKMASEITRIGKKWFVATPNRWFPFELHTRLPLTTWLPGRMYNHIGNLISYDNEKKKYVHVSKHESFYLLTASQLRRLFPCSKVLKHKVTLIAESLIVIGPFVEPEFTNPLTILADLVIPSLENSLA